MKNFGDLRLMLLFPLVTGLIGFSYQSAWADEIEDLPPDAPFISQVVHGVQYPLAKKMAVSGSVIKYYGDKLVSNMGFSIKPRYYLSETTWWQADISLLSPKADLGGGSMFGNTDAIVAADPQMVLGATYGYNPVYGKFVLNDQIFHFRAGFNTGLVLVKMKQVWGTGAETKDLWNPGVQGGLQMQVQLSESLVGELFTNLLYHQVASVGNVRYVTGWLYGLSVGTTF